MMIKIKVVFVTMLLSLCACSSIEHSAYGEKSQKSVERAMTIPDAVGNSARSEDDLKNDKGRKPTEVLSFCGVKPGDKVLDMFTGGGYYAELLSYTVDSSGLVYAHNNSAYRAFIGDKDAARYADNRLKNVVRLEQEVGSLDLASGSLDVATMMLAYHDIYYSSPTWTPLDGPQMLAEIHALLKPTGVFCVTDHIGTSGMETSDIKDLHRIDRERLIKEVESAGFSLKKESDVLRNANDNLSISVFDESVRGNTDRALLLFEKN